MGGTESMHVKPRKGKGGPRPRTLVLRQRKSARPLQSSAKRGTRTIGPTAAGLLPAFESRSVPTRSGAGEPPAAAPERLTALILSTEAATAQLLADRLARLNVDTLAGPPARLLAVGVVTGTQAVAILDWPRSRKEGPRLVQRIRKLPHGRDTLILTLLGERSAARQIEALTAGCDEVLVKPIVTSLLDLRLAALVRQAQDRSSLRAAGGADRGQEDALRRATAHLRTLLDTIPHGMFLKDGRGRYLTMNRTMADWLGASLQPAGDLPCQPNPDFSSQQRELISDTDRRVLSTGQPQEFEFRGIGQTDGKTRILRIVKHPLRDETGRIMGLVGFAQDMTQHRRDERELRDGRALLQAVLDAMPHAVFVKDREDRILMANKAMTAFQPGGSGSLVGERALDESRRPPEELEFNLRTTREVMTTGRRREYTRRITRAGMEAREVHTVKVPLCNAAGEVVGVVGVSEDITEIVKAMRELQESRSLLKALFDAIPHAVYAKDRNLRIHTVNRAMERLWDRPAKALIGNRVGGEGLRRPEEVEALAALDRRALDGGETVDTVIPYTDPAGTLHYHRVIKVPQRDESGRIVGVVGTTEDVTDRVKGEEELRRNQALLQTVFDTIPHDIVVKDNQRRFLMMNRVIWERWGAGAESFVGKIMPVPGVGPEEIREIEASDLQVLERGEPYAGISGRTMPDGTRRPFQVSKRALRDSQGAIVGLVGVSVDLSERLRAEQSLRESQALLQAVLDTIPHDIFVKDRERRFLLVNRAVSERWRQPPEYFVGKRSPIASHQPGEAEAIFDSDQRVLERGEAFAETIERTMPDGSRRQLHVIKSPLRDDTGRIVGIVGMSMDLTERLRTEEELRRSQALLQAVFDTIPAELVVKDRDRRIVMINRSTAERWKAVGVDAIGQTTLGMPLRPAEEVKRSEETDRIVLGEGRPVAGIRVRTLPSGERRLFHAIKAPLRDRDNRVTGIVAIADDITERHRAEEELKESQRLLRAIVDALPETVYVKDLQGRYTLVNSEMSRRLHLPREKLMGRTVENVTAMHPDTLKGLQEADQRVLQTGEVVALPEARLMFPGGREIWERNLKAPLRDAAGAIIGVVGIAEDVTDRHRAERALEASQRLLRTIIDTLPEALFVKDREGRYQLVNARHAQSYGLTPADFIGRRSAELPKALSASRMEWIRLSDREVLEHGRTMEIAEIPVIGGDGEGMWERIVKVPLRNESGEIVGIVGLREDITQRKKEEDERLALDRLMQRTHNLESLGAMAGGIAHDFNNLLQRILGYAELALLDVAADTPARTSVQMIHDAGVAAVELTRQMLTLSGRSRFALEPVDLNHLAETALPQIRKLLPQQVSVAVLRGAEAPKVMADAPLLRQVLQSLVSNASEALEGAGGGEITVATGAQQVERGSLDESYSDRELETGCYGYLEVRDTGPGLPTDVMTRLFEPFLSTKFMGRGLGLAAVRGIVRGHRGTIRVRSSEGAGAIFRVLLPVAAGAAFSGNSPEGI